MTLALALAGLETPVRLANHEDAAPAAHDAAIAVTLFRRFQRVDDLHLKLPSVPFQANGRRNILIEGQAVNAAWQQAVSRYEMCCI